MKKILFILILLIMLFGCSYDPPVREYEIPIYIDFVKAIDSVNHFYYADTTEIIRYDP